MRSTVTVTVVILTALAIRLPAADPPAAALDRQFRDTRNRAALSRRNLSDV